MKSGEGLADILREREPYYKKYANITVEYKSGDDLEKTVDNVIKALS